MVENIIIFIHLLSANAVFMGIFTGVDNGIVVVLLFISENYEKAFSGERI